MGELKNRERLQITLSNEIAKWLRQYSEKTKIPSSRIIENLLQNLKNSSGIKLKYTDLFERGLSKFALEQYVSTKHLEIYLNPKGKYNIDGVIQAYDLTIKEVDSLLLELYENNQQEAVKLLCTNLESKKEP